MRESMLVKKPHCLIKLHSFAPSSPPARTESLISIFGMRLDPPFYSAFYGSFAPASALLLELSIGYDQKAYGNESRRRAISGTRPPRSTNGRYRSWLQTATNA